MTDDDAPARLAADALTPATRDRFHIPTAPDGSPAIYLAGQSLGLQPRSAAAAIATEMDAWARQGVDAWFDPERPWFTLDASLRESMARIVGARRDEIALLNSLTVNIHLLLATFFRPAGRRRRILADGPLFPSDRHALTTHLAQRGQHPAADLVVLGPRDGEHLVRAEDLERAIEEAADDLALVFLSGVNFATGQAFDIERLTAAGHEAGALVGWDLAHAAGNIELALHDWDVDFAAWCTYKYLNGGPGSVGAIFVHERHALDPSLPRLGGWWGLDPDMRFDPLAPFEPAPGAVGWATSTTSIIALAPVAASLAIFDEVGMRAVRARSVVLTGHLEACLTDVPIEVITPRDPAARGAQLSLRHEDAPALLARLAARGVVADHRAPDLIRVAPIALYTTVEEIERFAAILRETLESLGTASAEAGA
jgi:kynureninase